jgi:hypothetical protein
MLTPEELLRIVETMQPHLDDLNTWIVRDMIRRLMARLERGEGLELTATDEWQAKVYQEAGGHLEALQREIASFVQIADAECRAIFEDAGIRAYEADAAVYRGAGIDVPPIRQSPHMVRILEDVYRRTNGEMRNYTRTTAQASQNHFIKALDTAHLKIMSGAQSYTAAVKDAVDEIAEYQAEVSYPSGHTEALEVAVLRAVRAGTAQASGDMAVQGMIDHDWDIVLVSAHLGARYGDGGENPGNHFWWQGKFYSRTGRTPGLPLFVESTGYGTGEGLSGWNCRHSFGPGDGEHNPYKDYDKEENKKAYDLSQKQRRMESAIRRTKKKLIGYREALENCKDAATQAELQAAYDKEALRLKRQNERYNEFCKENDLPRLGDRLQVAKWTRADASRSIAAVKRAETK